MKNNCKQLISSVGQHANFNMNKCTKVNRPKVLVSGLYGTSRVDIVFIKCT